MVLVSSGLHLKGLPEHGTYAATKAAVRSFARTFAMELKDRGIRVNTLSPGAIDTPIIDGQFKTKGRGRRRACLFLTITPLGRIGRPEEMASAVLFLASDDSSYSTGIDLVTDGGITQGLSRVAGTAAFAAVLPVYSGGAVPKLALALPVRRRHI